MQADTVHSLHGLLHVLDQALQVGRRRISVIDNEVRVFLGHRGIADAKTLQARRVDEPRGVIARRIGKNRPATPFANRLRRLAALEQLADLLVVDAVGALELQFRRQEPLFGSGRYDLPVADFEFARRARVFLTVPVDRFDFDDVAPGLTAEGAGIHGESPTQRPRNSRKKLSRAQSPLHALFGNACTGEAGLAVDICLVEPVETIERAVSADDDALETAVANQQVAAQPNPVEDRKSVV